jgi:hypothetical protein
VGFAIAGLFALAAAFRVDIAGAKAKVPNAASLEGGA